MELISESGQARAAAFPGLLGHIAKMKEEQSKPLMCEKHGEYMRGAAQERYTTAGISECPECACLRIEEEKRQEANSYLYYESGIPPRFVGKKFDGLVVSSPESGRVYSMIRGYAEKFPEHLECGRSLVLCGKTGTGKTLAICTAGEYIIRHHRKSCRYSTAYHIVRAIKASFSKGGQSEEEIISRFVSPHLLIIDEIGVQYGSDTEKLMLFEVINGRYEAMLPTIVVSNLDRNGIEEYLGDRVLDRLRENGGAVLAFDWKSFRQ